MSALAVDGPVSPEEAGPSSSLRLCSIEGCEKKHKGRGFCAAHYWRWWRRGDPLAGRAGPCRPIWGEGENQPRCSEHAEPMRWYRAPRRQSGGYWKCREKLREARERYDEKRTKIPGPCRRKGCEKPRKQYLTGKYGAYCHFHTQEHNHRQRGWFEPGGMATEPLYVKEL